MPLSLTSASTSVEVALRAVVELVEPQAGAVVEKGDNVTSGAAHDRVAKLPVAKETDEETGGGAEVSRETLDRGGSAGANAEPGLVASGPDRQERGAVGDED